MANKQDLEGALSLDVIWQRLYLDQAMEFRRFYFHKQQDTLFFIISAQFDPDGLLRKDGGRADSGHEPAAECYQGSQEEEQISFFLVLSIYS